MAFWSDKTMICAQELVPRGGTPLRARVPPLPPRTGCVLMLNPAVLIAPSSVENL